MLINTTENIVLQTFGSVRSPNFEITDPLTITPDLERQIVVINNPIPTDIPNFMFCGIAFTIASLLM